MSVRANIVADVLAERTRQDSLWRGVPGIDRFNADTYPAVLGEEVGEVFKAWLELDPVNMREELVQVAAVSMAWVEELDNGGRGTAP